jgi:hypothetical protein
VYVAPGIVSTVNCNIVPVQTGLLLDALGVVGVEFTPTKVVLSTLVQPLIVTFTVYVPVAAVVAFTIDGFCEEEENPFGPVHE